MQLSLLLRYIKQLLLNSRALTMLLPGMPTKTCNAACRLEFRIRQLSKARCAVNIHSQSFSTLLGNLPTLALNTKQFHHVQDAYEELIQLKTEMYCFGGHPYIYLLGGCIEQPIHHCWALRNRQERVLDLQGHSRNSCSVEGRDGRLKLALGQGPL